MREWSLRLHLLDEEGNERPADVFTKVVYNLHPTFENPTQSEFSAYYTNWICQCLEHRSLLTVKFSSPL